MQWNWVNFPVPNQYIFGLVIGGAAQLIVGGKLLANPQLGVLVGSALLVIGLAGSTWAVRQAGDTDIHELEELMTTGPYALSRNPMYVSWVLIYLGLGFIANSPWIVGLIPLLIAITHFLDVRSEERILEERLGDEYRQYKEQVRRYL